VDSRKSVGPLVYRGPGTPHGGTVHRSWARPLRGSVSCCSRIERGRKRRGTSPRGSDGGGEAENDRQRHLAAVMTLHPRREGAWAREEQNGCSEE
jgi:hypothetical protein